MPGDLLCERPLEAGSGVGVQRAHVDGADQVLAHRAVEGEEVLDHGRGVVRQVPHVAGEPVDRAGAELVARRVGDHAGVGLVADPQAVVGEQAGGVGVVRRDRRLEDVLPLLGLLQRARGGQRLADLAAQLARGLGRERQAEHLVGTDLAGDDEVDDPGGHQRGLARAGAGDHDRGLAAAPRSRPTAGRWRRTTYASPAGAGRGCRCGCSLVGHRACALDRADRDERAVAAVLAGDGRERLGPQQRRGVREPLTEQGAVGSVLGLDVLGLHDRGVAAVDQAELHQLGATGPGLGDELLDGAVVDGVLVEAELEVALDRLGARASCGRS